MDKEDLKMAINEFNGAPLIMYLRDEEHPYYIYIVDEVDGEYGEQKLAVADGMDTIYALPSIKAFEELDVGRFYKIKYLGLEEFENGWTRHNYAISIVSEEEYDRCAFDNFSEEKVY